jgi:hypothetical protein
MSCGLIAAQIIRKQNRLKPPARQRSPLAGNENAALAHNPEGAA